MTKKPEMTGSKYSSKATGSTELHLFPIQSISIRSANDVTIDIAAVEDGWRESSFIFGCMFCLLDTLSTLFSLRALADGRVRILCIGASRMPLSSPQPEGESNTDSQSRNDKEQSDADAE